jgi:hypothetical protein
VSLPSSSWSCNRRELNVNNIRTFHGVDMIKNCARGFLDERGIAQYEFSGEHDYYKDVLHRIYRPLAESGLIQENENNNFTIPADSRLHDICRTEINGKAYIIWKDFRSLIYKAHNFLFSFNKRTTPSSVMQ